ncbi:MAG TPA: DUF935 family protein [Opitutaceae bacterium]
MAKSKKKTESRLGAERVQQAMLAMDVGLRGLSAQKIARAADDFDLGQLRDADMIWQKMRDRDDTLKAVSEKRELDGALLNWEILPVDDSPEAQKHKEALEAFYNNLTVTHALDRNQRGGVSTLVKQMLHSVGHKYAVHEIVWDPSGPDLTAELRFTPLRFFENTTGQLRFLPTEGAWKGEELEPDGWMVTVGAGLMIASSICYFYKHLPLKAWLIFCDKFGMPGLHGETTAAPGTQEWEDFKAAIAAFAQDWALVTSPGSTIKPIEVNASSTGPHKELVERMDRALARLWRGADLGTMSQQGEGTGSNPQESETDILGAADAMIVSETCQQYLDEAVIRYRFGTEPLAYFQLQPKVKLNQELELKIDEALVKMGVPIGKKALLRRYARPEPDKGDELATAPAAGPALPFAQTTLANEADPDLVAFVARVTARAGIAEREVLAPILDRLAQIQAISDPAAQRTALERFAASWPELAKQALARTPRLAAEIEKGIGTALVNGFAQHAKKTGKTS